MNFGMLKALIKAYRSGRITRAEFCEARARWQFKDEAR